MKIFFLILALAILGACFYKRVQLNQNCTGYLKRAADANSIEMAKKQLDIAINFLEAERITHGYTSVWYKTPDEDISYWYQNLKSCQQDLNDSTRISSVDGEKLTLLKLRQTLLDQGEKGDKVTYPKGLAYYPNNLNWGAARVVAVGVLIVLFFLFYPEKNTSSSFRGRIYRMKS